MIAAMHCGSDRIGLFCGRNAEGNGEHDGIAVGDDGQLHAVLGIMPVRDFDVVGQGGAGQQRADRSDIDDVTRDAQSVCAGAGKPDFLFVTLSVVERDEPQEFGLVRDLVRQGDRIEPAGTHDNGLHFDNPCFLRVGCDRGPRHSGAITENLLAD